MNISFANSNKSRLRGCAASVLFRWSLLIESFCHFGKLVTANTASTQRFAETIPPFPPRQRNPGNIISSDFFKDHEGDFEPAIFSVWTFTSNEHPICTSSTSLNKCPPRGAYVGVRSGQNFTYIAKLRPRIAAHRYRRRLYSH